MDAAFGDLILGRKEIQCLHQMWYEFEMLLNVWIPQIIGDSFLVEYIVINWDGELYLFILQEDPTDLPITL